MNKYNIAHEKLRRNKGRYVVVFIFFLSFSLMIVMQLCYINIYGTSLNVLSHRQTYDTLSVKNKRGNIYDVNGAIIAKDLFTYKIAIDPYVDDMNDEMMKQLCQEIEALDISTHDSCLNKIKSKSSYSRYIILANKVEVEQYDTLKTIAGRALIAEKQYSRRYIDSPFVSHVGGYVNRAKEGIYGIEKQYDDDLRGHYGKKTVRSNLKRQFYSYFGAPNTPAKDGHNIYLTIDGSMQKMVENMLQEGIIESGAEQGTAIFMEPATGAIKAMAHYPNRKDGKDYFNYAISSEIEVGSTIKLVTAFAALAQNKVSLDEIIPIPEDGKLNIHDQILSDHEAFGDLTFGDAIIKSSNIAIVKVNERLEDKIFYQYMKLFGVANVTGIDMPNESSGKLPYPSTWSEISQPWMSIGYGVALTPLQILLMYSALANRGMIPKPYMVHKIMADNEVVYDHEPQVIRNIQHREIFASLLPIFEGVVSPIGTGKNVYVPGLAIAGKTGTVQRYLNGRYGDSYRALFVGFFPSDNPRYLGVVVLENPIKKPHGGESAGPIFKNIAVRLALSDPNVVLKNQPIKHTKIRPLSFLGHTRMDVKALLKNSRIQIDWQGEDDIISNYQYSNDNNVLSINTTSQMINVKRKNEREYIVLPDFKGINMRQAYNQIISYGVRCKLHGSGVVVSQFPYAGEWVRVNGEVSLRGNKSQLGSEFNHVKGGEK